MPMTRLAVKCLSYPFPDYVVAQSINVSNAKFSGWTLGRQPLPARIVLKLAILFRCDPSELVGWADDVICIDDNTGATT